ncbi:uncharacterized protein LOC110064051 [Orbicella faveolata]|uniref:uncharacterized protein LOC110064051 n=1 Tax=Orbicella faveolata TaxID=48498 RepID=UPI0009E5B3C4|nr:uncharacterized protein LOC110064051 [Orbicella faveolata]
MLDQAVLVSSRVAFMFVLFLASVNWASANPVCTECGNSTADSASKTVVDYNVQMRESGEQYNETIEVDTEKQTELFKVPAHGNVDHFNILHDFKKVCLVTSKKSPNRSKNIRKC